MTTETASSNGLVKNSTLYREFQAEREEILKHKWIESEKVGYDIGFERALLDWIRKHREGWRAARRQTMTPPGPGSSASPFSGQGSSASPFAGPGGKQP